MKVPLILTVLVGWMSDGQFVKLETVTGTKAASPYENYGCQCDSLIFTDDYGKVHGNCKSGDSTGAKWCYLPLYVQSTCSDQNNHGHTSSRFPNKWSYEACATPGVSGSYGSNICGVQGRTKGTGTSNKGVHGRTTGTSNKAASLQVNYGCQCNSLTFQDKSGKVHGNCKSSDHTGAKWCYLPLNVKSTCSDQHDDGHTSSRFPNKWSYEACATPTVHHTVSGSNDKAASTHVNYGCKCNSLTFQDDSGKVQGNCRSSDSTGARWCYLPIGCDSTCSDQRNSNRFPNKWSYEACATSSYDYYDDNSINGRNNPTQ